MISFQEALPLFIFLIVSFLAFYFVETILLFILNHLIRRHWQLIVDKLLHAIVHHRLLTRSIAIGSILLLVILLFFLSPLHQTLFKGAKVFRMLALILIVSMLIIYWIGSRSLSKTVIERRIHLYIFLVFSLLVFTGIMNLAKRGYPIYKNIVNQTLLDPIVKNIEKDYEEKVEDRLLSIFREEIKKGNCPYTDYSENSETSLTQFVFIHQDPEFKDKSQKNYTEEEPLKGRQCTHESTFLFTEDGKWYQVIKQDFN